MKPGHSDPEGETTTKLFRELGYKVESVGVGKVYRVTVDAESRKNAELCAGDMCRRLLANPTKDDYSITFEEKQ